MIKIITKIVYVGNYIFFINNSIDATYDDLVNANNYNSYKKELTMFMRKLKLLKLINKSEKELYNTEIWSMLFIPNYDFSSLYPNAMKSFNVKVGNIILGTSDTYIRK